MTIVGTGGKTQHTAEGAKNTASLVKKKENRSDADQIITSTSRGVGKSNRSNSAASAFTPVMSKKSSTTSSKQQTQKANREKQKADLDKQAEDLAALRKKRANERLKTLGSSSSGMGVGVSSGSGGKEIESLTQQIKTADDKLKKDTLEYYGYEKGTPIRNAFRRVGRTLEGTGQSVAGQYTETLGQQFNTDLAGSNNPNLARAAKEAQTSGGKGAELFTEIESKNRQRREKYLNKADELSAKGAENIEMAKGGLGAIGQTAIDVLSEGTKMAGDMALNTVAPGSGVLALGARAFGSGAQQARYAGATENQQRAYGGATAGLEALTEMTFNGSWLAKKAYGAGLLDATNASQMLDEVVGKVIKNPTIALLTKHGIEEQVEEQLSDLLDPVARMIYDRNAAHDAYFTSEGLKQLAQDTLYDGLIGFLLGSIGATGNVVERRTTGQKILNDQSETAIMAEASSFPLGSKTRAALEPLVEKAKTNQRPSALEVGQLVQSMQEDFSNGKKPDATRATLEVITAEDGTSKVVHRMNDAETALFEAGMSAEDAATQGEILTELVLDADGVSNKTLKNKLNMTDPTVRTVFEEMIGQPIAIPANASKAEQARIYRSAAENYRTAQEDAVRALQEEKDAIDETQAALDEAVAANEEKAQAEAAKMLDGAVAQAEATQPQGQQTQQPTAPRAQTREEFFNQYVPSFKAMFGTEPTPEQLEAAWRKATDKEGILLDNGEFISRQEFYDEVRKGYLEEEGVELTDDNLEALYDQLRRQSRTRPVSTADWAAKTGAQAETAPEATESTETNPAETAPATSAKKKSKAEAKAQPDMGEGQMSFEDMSFSVDQTGPDEMPSPEKVQAGKSVSLEQAWTAAFLQNKLAPKGIEKIIFDGANMAGENAHILDGVLYLNENALPTQKAIVWAVGHEITHPATEADAAITDAVIETMQKLNAEGKLGKGRAGRDVKVMLDDLEGTIKDKQDAYRAFFRSKGVDAKTIERLTTEEAMRVELANDLIGYALANQNILDNIAGVKPSLLTKAMRALETLRTSRTGTELLEGGRNYRAAMQEIEALADRLSTALDKWQEGQEAGAPVDRAEANTYNNITEPEQLGGERNGEGLPEYDRGRSVGSDQERAPGLREGRGAGEQGLQGGPGLVSQESRSDQESGRVAPQLPRLVRLSPESLEIIERSVTPVDVSENTADYAAFSSALDAAKEADTEHGWAVTPQSAEELAGKNGITIMAKDGGSGVFVTEDGDIEGVFRNIATAPPGALRTLMPLAIENGGRKLDCYGENLVRQYAKSGFVPVAKVKFDPAQANAGWTPDKGEPDIYFMMYTGPANADAVVANYGKGPVYTKEQLNALPYMEYGEAMDYRDDALTKAMKDTAPAGETDASSMPENAKFSVASDLDYANAIKSGKMGTAQAMADEAAKKAGYKVLAYHGSPANNIQIFDGWNGVSYFTNDERYANGYAWGSENGRAIQKARRAQKNLDNHFTTDAQGMPQQFEVQDTVAIPEDYTGEPNKFFADGNSDAIYYAEGMRQNSDGTDYEMGYKQVAGWHTEYDPERGVLKVVKGVGEEEQEYRAEKQKTIDAAKDLDTPKTYKVYLKMNNPYISKSPLDGNQFSARFNDGSDPEYTDRALARLRELKAQGYDGVIVPSDAAMMNAWAGEDENADAVQDYVVFSPEQVKSAEPATYDETGELIPLSQRFNPEDKRINYSISGGAPWLDEVLRRARDLSTDEGFQGFTRDFYSGYGSGNPTEPLPASEPKVSRVRSNTLKAMGVPMQFTEEHQQALDEANYEYDPISEQESMRRAEERLNTDYEGEKEKLSKAKAWTGEDLDAAMGILAVELKKAQQSGNYEEAEEWTHLIREQGTKGGQLIQSFAKYNRTPEGVVVRAAEDLEETKLKPEQKKELLGKITEFANTLTALRPDAKGDMANPNGLVDLIVEQAKQRKTRVSKPILKELQRRVDIGQVQYLYDFALTQLDQIAKDYIPASAGKKAATFQTIMHLLNLRTGMRNLVSNTVFGEVAALANDFAMVPDLVLSLMTGQRTVGFDRGHLSKQTWAGMHDRGGKARLEASLDVNPDANAKDKYGTARRTWKMTGNLVQKGLSTVEKAMAYELNWTDEFRKGAVEAEIIRSLAPMVEKGTMTMEQAKAFAEQEMLYRTFQDDTYMNKLLAGIKKVANTKLVREYDANGNMTIKVGQADFGLGDIIQKYTQVPGALITRAVEFAPTGYIKAIYHMARLAKQSGVAKQAQAKAESAAAIAEKSDKQRLKNAAARAFKKAETENAKALSMQREAALSFGRAMTGTGLITLFAILAKAGVLHRDDDEIDADMKALRSSEGLSGTQLNYSALQRWASGGDAKWQNGDVLMSVDFLEPVNNLLTMGTKIADTMKNDPDSNAWDYTLDTADALWRTMQEIPTMQTLKTAMDTAKYHKEDSALPVWAEIPIEIARGSATGFVWSPIRQTAQAIDPYYRDAYTSNELGQQTLDAVKNAIPGLRQQLPEKLDNYGQPKKQESQPLNALNAFLIPGQVRTYNQSEVSKELSNLYTKTGSANIYPDRTAPYTLKSDSEANPFKVSLDAEQRQQYQQTRGTVTYVAMEQALRSPDYQAASTSERAEIMSNIKNYANYVAKVQALKEQNINYSDAKYEKVTAAGDAGISPATYYIVYGSYAKYDADNNGSMTQAEVQAALDAAYFGGTPEQANEKRAIMWQLYNKQWSEKNNPYR